MLTGFLLAAIAAWLLLVTLLFFAQRMLVYPGAWHPAAGAGPGEPPPGFAAIRLETEDGERLAAWWRAPAAPGSAVVLYFHGNGGTLRHREARVTALPAEGRGLLIVSYRGYAGSTGTPTEDGLMRDARAAHDFVTRHAPEAPLVVYGESLGTGVAVRLAAERRVTGVALETPFTSTMDVARGGGFWFVPVGLLMRDRFESIARIHAIGVPLLILHGDRDAVVPFALGRRLFEAAVEPKRFVPLRGVGHSEVLERGGLAPMLEFLVGIERGGG
jgi:fermentation-respiration switch protein FrsA (DUF1100 family)